MGSLQDLWFVHGWLMDLDNPFEIIIHYLLIGGMTCLSLWDEIFKVSALVYMITH